MDATEATTRGPRSGEPGPDDAAAAGVLYPVRTLFADVLHFVRPYRGRFALTLLVLLASELSGLYPGWALGKMVTLLVHAGGPGDTAERRFWLLLALWAVFGCGHYLLRELGHYHGFQIAEKAGLDAKVAALRHLFALDLDWHERENTGNRMKRIANGEDGVHQLLRMALGQLLPALVSTVGAVAVLFAVNRPLSAALLLFILVYYPLSHWLTRHALREAVVVHQREEALEGFSFEAVSNILTVKALRLGGALHRLLVATVGRLMESIRRRIFVYRIREGSVNLYATLFRLLATAYIGYGILHLHFEIGLLVLFNTYFDNVWRATSDLSYVSNETQVRAVAVSRMMSILNARPVLETMGSRPMPPDWRQISLAGVTFSYQDQPVL